MQNYKPIEYLERDKENIIERLVCDIHTYDEANKIYALANDFIKRLSVVRESENKTISILNEIRELDVNVARSLRYLLIDSIDEDDSFYYAYNKLIQFSNRNHGTDFPVKYGISRKILLKLIDDKGISDFGNKLTAPIISLFCYYVNLTIDPIGNRTVEDYCKYICKKYDLKYTDRVRQNFGTKSDVPKNRQNVKAHILQNIDVDSKTRIEEFLNTKYNLYA